MSISATLGIVLSVFVPLAGASVAAESPFSGTWVLDPSKGVLSDARPRDIQLSLADDGQTVTVTERIPGKKDDRFTCRSDAKPCEQRKSSSVYRRVLKREPGTLVWQNSMTRLADDASISWTERWSLSDDGRTLTVHKVFPGNREFLEIFRRAGS